MDPYGLASDDPPSNWLGSASAVGGFHQGDSALEEFKAVPGRTSAGANFEAFNHWKLKKNT